MFAPPFVRPLVALAAVLCVALPARAAAHLVEVDLMCPITAVTPVAGGLEIDVARGSAHGLIKDARGDVYEKSATSSSGIGEVVARAVVVSVDKDSARLRVAAVDPVVARRVDVGAQVEVRALLPSDAHRGLLRELALVGVVFLDNYKAPLVPLEELLVARDDALENRVLDQMIVAGHEVIEFTGELKQLVTHGPDKGLVCARILETADREDYRRFLRFVREYPGKYIGKPWKISETFATWIINDEPSSAADRLAEVQAMTPAEVAVDMRSLRGSDLRSFVDDFLDKALADPAKDAVARAQRLLTTYTKLRATTKLEKSKGVVETPAQHAVEKTWLKARALSFRGDVKLRGARKGWPAAVADYLQAATLFAGIGEAQSSLIARNSAANTMFNLKCYDDVLKQVALVRAQVTKERAKETNPQARASLTLRAAYAIQLAARIDEARGNYDDVVAALSPLVETYAEAGFRGARESQLDALQRIAKARTKLGEIEEAKLLYGRMEQTAAELDDRDRQASLAWDLGDACWGQGQYEQALAAYLRSAEHATRAGSDTNTARAKAGAAQTLWNLGRYQEALALHDDAMALRTKIGDSSGIAWEQEMKAGILLETGDRTAAEIALRQALAAYEQLDDDAAAAGVHNQLGRLHSALSRYELADQAHATAEAIYARLKRAPDEAGALQYRAVVALKRKDDARALKLIDRSVLIYARIRSAELPAALTWKAAMLTGLGKRDSSRAVLDRALKLTAKDSGVRVDVLVALGRLLVQDGKLAPAAKDAADALALARKNKDINRQIAALSLTSEILGKQAHYAQSSAAIDEAVGLARSSGSRPQLTELLQNQSWQLVRLGRLSDAKKALEEAVPITEAIGDPVQRAWLENNRANLAGAYGDVREELRHFDAAVDLATAGGDRFTEGALVYNRSQVHLRLRDFERTLQDLDRAEKLAGKTVNSEFKIALLTSRGEVLGRMERYPAALASLNGRSRWPRRPSPRAWPER